MNLMNTIGRGAVRTGSLAVDLLVDANTCCVIETDVTAYYLVGFTRKYSWAPCLWPMFVDNMTRDEK